MRKVLRKFCGKFAEVRIIAANNCARKECGNATEVCGNFAESLRNVFCNDPFPNSPRSEMLRRESISASTIAALFVKMALTSQRMAIIDMFLLSFFLAHYVYPVRLYCSQESPRQTKPKKGPKQKVHEFRHFCEFWCFSLGKTSTIHIELLFQNAPVKCSWTDLSLVWFARATSDVGVDRAGVPLWRLSVLAVRALVKDGLTGDMGKKALKIVFGPSFLCVGHIFSPSQTLPESILLPYCPHENQRKLTVCKLGAL